MVQRFTNAAAKVYSSKTKEGHMMQGTVQRDKIYIYDTCNLCKQQDVLVYACGDQLLCAEHARVWIRENPSVQLCDKCGAEGNVFRDPSHRRNEYLCVKCHDENGFRPSNTVANRAFRELMEGKFE